MDGCIRFHCLRPGLLGLCLMLVASSAMAVEPKAANPPVPKSPVRVAALSYIEPDGTRRPVVEVWSNGLVKAIDLSGSRQNPVQATLTDRLTAAELRELHQLLIGDCQLANQTTDSVRKSLQIASEQHQLTAKIEGAAETEIGVLAGHEWRTVSCPAVSILATRFPDVAEVRNIAAAQSRLQNIYAVALVGGGKAADLHAATATHKLQEVNPNAGEITRRDLTMVRHLPNESRFVQFRYAGSPGQDDGCLVNLTQSPEGTTRVSVMDSPSVVR